MKTFAAMLIAGLVGLVLNMIGAIAFSWNRGGGAIPQAFIGIIVLWVFFKAKDKLNA